MKSEIVSKLRELAREIENTHATPLGLDGDPKPLDEVLADLLEEYGRVHYMLNVVNFYGKWTIEHRFYTEDKNGSKVAKAITLAEAVANFHELMKPGPEITTQTLGEFVPTLTAPTPMF